MVAWIHRFKGLGLGLVTLILCLGLAQVMAPSPPSLGALAQSNPPPPTLAPALPMVSGTFKDGEGRFQIGILEGYRVSTAGGSPLFQAADGSLAYTVAIAPLPTTVDLASEVDLLNAANRTFGQGEGFTLGDTQPIAGGGLRINWVGRLSQGTAPPLAITGKIFARQRDRNVFLLLVAATPAAKAQVSDAIITLGSTLTVP